MLLGGFLGGILLEELFGRNFLGGFFWGGFFGRILWENFFGRIFWEEFFGRNYLVEINMDGCFCQNLGVILSQWRRRKEGGRIFNP